MDWLQRIYNAIISFKDWLFTVLAYIYDILQTIFYWAVSLLTWLYDIIVELLNVKF